MHVSGDTLLIREFRLYLILLANPVSSPLACAALSDLTNAALAATVFFFSAMRNRHAEGLTTFSRAALGPA